MSPRKSEQRKKVAVLLTSKPNFDAFALKYFILSLNKIQSTYEFVFPEINTSFYDKKYYTRDSLFSSFSEVNKHIGFEGKPDYFINIIKSRIEQNLFWECRSNVAFITTDLWERLFSPPSLFEYLLHCISATLIVFKTGLGSHTETRGCVLDYTKYKMDDKVDISLGYICDNCKKTIAEGVGLDYLEDISIMISRSWVGDIDTFDSVAYNLKRFFKFDINKDSGFNKTFWERAKEHFPEIPKEAILMLISVIIGAVIVWLSNHFN
jgi:hypothetical protein